MREVTGVENSSMKGKVEDLYISAEKEVFNMVVPAISTGKRKYIKKDMDYWESTKRKGKGNKKMTDTSGDTGSSPGASN